MEGLDVSVEASENFGVADVEQLPQGLELCPAASGHGGVFCVLLGFCARPAALGLVVDGGESVSMLYHLLGDDSLGGGCVSGRYF